MPPSYLYWSSSSIFCYSSRSPYSKGALRNECAIEHVISDIVGETGLHIIEAIIAGEREPKQLASLCSSRIKASRETVAKSLHGNWEEALLFGLKTALESYRFNQSKIQECDGCIQQHLAQFASRTELSNSPQNLKTQLHRVCGVDLTKIPGIKEQSAQIIISEVGLDMTKWNTEKQFCSFLGLCPNNSISGGKYELKFQLQRIKWLKKEAKSLNLKLVAA